MADNPAHAQPLNAAAVWAKRVKLPFIPTFSPRLNEVLKGGLLATGCYVCTGAPGSGKTTLALDIVSAAIESGAVVIYVSTELTPQLVIARHVSKKLKIEWLDALNSEDPAIIEASAAIAAELGDRLWVLDPEQATEYQTHVRGIRKWLNDEATEKHGKPVVLPTLLVIDYIQDLAETRIKPGVDARTAVSSLSRELRLFANEQFIPLWIISSTSRAFYGRNAEESEGNELAGAKESGSVEYNVNAVLHIRRKDASDKTFVEIIVAKNRFGASAITIIFEVEPETGALTETAASSGELALSNLMYKIMGLVSEAPGKYASAKAVAQAVSAKGADVKKALDVLFSGYGAYRIVADPAQANGFFVVKKSEA